MASEHLSQRFENMASSAASNETLKRRSPRCAPRRSRSSVQKLIELEASQATKTDHTEAEVLAEAERLRAVEEACVVPLWQQQEIKLAYYLIAWC